MRLRFTERADKDYADLPPAVRKAFAKQLRFLLANLMHPSLRAKQDDGGDDLWQARVARNWRFYFQSRGRRIRHHLDYCPPQVSTLGGYDMEIDVVCARTSLADLAS